MNVIYGIVAAAIVAGAVALCIEFPLVHLLADVVFAIVALAIAIPACEIAGEEIMDWFRNRSRR